MPRVLLIGRSWMPSPSPSAIAPLAAAFMIAACAQATSTVTRSPSATITTDPPTRAERTHYAETSTDSDVTTFLSTLAHRTGRLDFVGLRDTTLGAAPIELSAYDSSTNGGLIPFVIAARPAALSARDAHAKGRPVVFIEAGAGGDDGAGTDALLAVLRDLLAGQASKPNVLDSILLVAVPLANPDAVVPGMSSRGLTIISPIAAPDTDLVAATARETRTTLAILHDWQPDVVIDLRAADAGGAAYPLTLGPPLAPAAVFVGPYTADSLLPELRLRLAEVRKLESFRCGAITPPWAAGSDSTHHAYHGCDHRARVLTNYAGLANRLGVLARTNAADSVAVQVRAATSFLEEVLSLIAVHGPQILARTTAADTTVEAWGGNPDGSPDIPLRATRSASGPIVPILVDQSQHDTSAHLPHVVRPHPMPVHDQLTVSVRRRLPAGYILEPGDTATVRLLQRHGITIQRHTTEMHAMIVERFIIDSVTTDSTWHDADHPPRLAGHWLRAIGPTTLPAGTVVVPCSQPLGLLAMILLEPESDDGFVTWHQFDARLHAGAAFPVAKLIE